jgi:hypothetical protein
MNRSFVTTLRATGLTIAVTVGVAFVLALIFLGIAQSFPETLGSGRIQWGDYSTTIAGAFSGGILEFLVASSVVTFGILAVIAAIIFTVIVMLLAVAVTAAALLLSALLVSLPLIAFGAAVWWAARRNTKPQSAPLGAQSQH